MPEDGYDTVYNPGGYTYRRETQGVVNPEQGWSIRSGEVIHLGGTWEFWEFDWRGKLYTISKEDDRVFEDEGRTQIEGERSQVVLKAFRAALETGAIPEDIEESA